MGNWGRPAVTWALGGFVACGSPAPPASIPPQPGSSSSPAGAPTLLARSEAKPAVATAAAGASPQSSRDQAATVDTSMFFANIDVSRDPRLQPSELRLAVHVADGPFGELSRRGLAAKVRDGKLLVRLPHDYPASRDPVTRQHRACSYVIDCDSDAIKSLRQGQLTEHPHRDELVRFASAYITSKSLSRGFDVASDVAKNKEGDCSEHAVLLAAVARRYGFAARVVFGFAVLRFSDRLPILVGHAWTELHDGTEWQLADAALVDSGIDRVAHFAGLTYLPVQLLQREDAGFRAKLVTEPGCWQVERAEGQY